ncbi:hypothetical protein [Christiangramia crocea]|uniref:Lipoprotein n=1 Tax=Christiangramia crocea TaxID=2904124 RepID=A0A9X1UVB9_9FLAO|nr:hypothetical protein [Gramella crocea]MCG9970781.1 hypothetical protein [Gramella crocea]
MKKLINLFVLLILIVGCENNNKELSEKFEKLQSQRDSISQVHSKFKSIHDEMLKKFQNFNQKLGSMDVQDSTIFEDVAKHSTILEQHDAIIKSHDEILEGHKEMKTSFDEKSEAEKKTQIEEMIATHKKLMEEHKAMEEDHSTMEKEHEEIMVKLDSTDTSN